MISIPQQTPWSPIHNREIADAHGNVVQYTQENIGLICLAINSHKRLMDALVRVEEWLEVHGPDHFPTETADLVAEIRQATGRIGAGAVASIIGAATEASAALDRAIAMELQCPEMAFTSNTDLAMSLIPPGWTMSIGTEGSVCFNGPNTTHAISGEKSLPMKICEGAMWVRAV